MPQLQTGRYRVRIATDACDLRAARQLRFRCFRAPALVSAWAGPEAETGEDADPLDAHCRHMLVEHRESGRLAACFRWLPLGSGAEIGRSYSAQHYELSRLRDFPEPMIEVGRFCVDPAHSHPEILRLAWAALARQVDETGAGAAVRLLVLRRAGCGRPRARLCAAARPPPGAAALAPRRQGARGLPLCRPAGGRRPRKRPRRATAAAAQLSGDGGLGQRPRGAGPRAAHHACVHRGRGAADPARAGARPAAAGGLKMRSRSGGFAPPRPRGIFGHDESSRGCRLRGGGLEAGR
ncbi:Acetyltransferase (GNAT) domain-containing protein [Paracoccus solventivorans]|uniref:L-ornithine N(alpha)-acyltransferase n=1 Tax=Paracoccus solventivorans TaxID=53463 RepID=A0A1M7HCS6_9RHOB|nr:Acetyltransferase (GNAT) domain-containing protein [Paracoccus solventivorans]